MGFGTQFASPRLQLAFRYGQAAIAIAFLILIAWCNQNRGSWLKADLTGPLALGSITFVLTLGLSIYQIVCLHRNTLAMGGKLLFRLPVEVLLVLLWGGSAGLMVKHKGQDFADDRWFLAPPTVEWTLAEVFGWVECLWFVITSVMVFLSSRSVTKSGGGGATYV